MAIGLCDIWEKDAQQFWKHAINLWPDGQGGVLKITGDGKLPTEGTGGVGMWSDLEKEEWWGTWQKLSFPPPEHLQSRRTETIYLTRLLLHLLAFLTALSQAEIDLSAPLICSQKAVSLTPRSQALPLKTRAIWRSFRYRNDQCQQGTGSSDSSEMFVVPGRAGSGAWHGMSGWEPSWEDRLHSCALEG